MGCLRDARVPKKKSGTVVQSNERPNSKYLVTLVERKVCGQIQNYMLRAVQEKRNQGIIVNDGTLEKYKQKTNKCYRWQQRIIKKQTYGKCRN